MIKAHKLNKEMKRAKSKMYSDCYARYTISNKILNYIILLLALIVPFLPDFAFYPGDKFDKLALPSYTGAYYVLIYVFIVYKDSVFFSKASKRDFIAEEYGVSYISYKLYKPFKVILFSIVVSLGFYLFDYFDIIVVYVKYNESVRFAYLNWTTLIIYILIIATILDVTSNNFADKISGLTTVYLISSFASSILFSGFSIGLPEDDITSTYLRVTDFSFFGNMGYPLFSLSVAFVVLLIAIKLFSKAARGHAYD